MGRQQNKGFLGWGHKSVAKHLCVYVRPGFHAQHCKKKKEKRNRKRGRGKRKRRRRSREFPLQPDLFSLRASRDLAPVFQWRKVYQAQRIPSDKFTCT